MRKSKKYGTFVLSKLDKPLAVLGIDFVDFEGVVSEICDGEEIFSLFNCISKSKMVWLLYSMSRPGRTLSKPSGTDPGQKNVRQQCPQGVCTTFIQESSFNLRVA
jgi:hypothetical protein